MMNGNRHDLIGSFVLFVASVFLLLPTLKAQSARFHDARRRVIHFNVTASPTSEWTARQIAEAFPWDTAPRYMLHDRDSIYGESSGKKFERWRFAK
jgi:hypothetical protein